MEAQTAYITNTVMIAITKIRQTRITYLSLMKLTDIMKTCGAEYLPLWSTLCCRWAPPDSLFCLIRPSGINWAGQSVYGFAEIYIYDVKRLSNGRWYKSSQNQISTCINFFSYPILLKSICINLQQKKLLINVLVKISKNESKYYGKVYLYTRKKGGKRRNKWGTQIQMIWGSHFPPFGSLTRSSLNRKTTDDPSGWAETGPI